MLETKPERIALQEWQEKKGSIFEYIIGTGEAPYLSEVDALFMDVMLGSMFGSRKVRAFFENRSAEEVGHIIHKAYGQTWTNEYILYKKLEELEGDSVTVSEDEQSSGTDRSTTTNQTNKISGFDGSDLVDDNGADIAGTDSMNTTSSSKTKSATTTQAGILNKIDAIEAERLYQQICEDIAGFITLAIY